MTGVIPNYRQGPTSWQVCGYNGVGTPTTITGGQLVHPNAGQPSMVEPCTAGALNFLGVAANDAAAPRTSQDAQNPAVISQQPDIVAVHYGVDIDVTYAQNAGAGDLLIAAANGQVTPYLTGFAAPAVPATGVTAQNTSGQEVTVVISGGTLTQVWVGPNAAQASNTQVGTTAGTYIVPAGQYISIVYTVAPTWTWSSAGTASSFSQIVGRCTQPLGVVIATLAVGSARIAAVV